MLWSQIITAVNLQIFFDVSRRIVIYIHPVHRWHSGWGHYYGVFCLTSFTSFDFQKENTVKGEVTISSFHGEKKKKAQTSEAVTQLVQKLLGFVVIAASIGIEIARGETGIFAFPCSLSNLGKDEYEMSVHVGRSVPVWAGRGQCHVAEASGLSNQGSKSVL